MLWFYSEQKMLYNMKSPFKNISVDNILSFEKEIKKKLYQKN